MDGVCGLVMAEGCEATVYNVAECVVVPTKEMSRLDGCKKTVSNYTMADSREWNREHGGHDEN
jgi:hypothetical protein